MASKCDNVKQLTQNIEEADELRQREKDEFWQSNKSLAKFLNYSKEDILAIEDALSTDDMADKTEKDLNKILLKKYGNKGQRAIIASKIVGLMEGSELLTDIAEEIVLNNLPKDFTVRFKKGQIDYSSIPISTLKSIYREFLIHVDADDGTNLAKGVYGAVIVPITTPTQLSKREKTGAMYKMVKATKRYHKAIARRMSDFNNAPVTTKSKRKYGMNDVINAVRDISSDLRWTNMPDKKERLVSLFSRMMTGHIYIDPKTNEFMIYENWMPTGKTYETTGDSIYAFQNPVMLKDYTPPNSTKGAWDLPLSNRAKKEMLKQIDRARKVDDELLKYTEYHFKSSVNSVINSLANFTNIDKDQLKKLIESKDYKSEALYKILTSEQKKGLDALYDVFGDIIQIRPIIHGSTNIQYKKNHFPIIYPERTFPILWDNMIIELTDALKTMTADIKALEGEDRKLLKKKILKTNQALARAEFIRDRMDEYPVDATQNIPMPLAKDVKHLETISNAIDIRNMRTDAGVYQRYTKHIMSAIERNLLIAQFIDSYGTAQSDFARNYILNMFKIPFNRPDIEGNFLGIKYSTEGMLSGLGLNVMPNVVQDKVRMMSSWLTASKLSGFGTTMQNYMAMHQNLINYGLGHTYDAYDDYKHNKDKWGRLIAASGIAEFGDFFNDALVKEMSNIELESDISKRLHISMMNYLKNKSIKGNKKARKEFDEEVSSILDGSGLWMSEVLFDPLNPDVENYKERIKRRQKTLKRKRKVDFTNKLVAYAISMEWQMNKSLKGWKVIPAKTFDLTVGAYARLRKKFEFTMSDTEQFIRSVSFVIGVRRGQKLGYLPSGNPWDFSTKDYNNAIDIGTKYQEFTNFGLSTQDVGQYNWGDLGKLTGKFKYWSQQKAGLDVRIIRDAIISMKDIEDIKGTKSDLFDGKAIYRVVKAMGGKNLNVTNPEAARLRRFLLIQGTLTTLFDLFISPVAFIPHVRGWFYNVPGARALRGVSSDILSLSFMPLTIALRIGMAGLFYEDDEPEKDIKDTFKYYLRRSFFGFLPVWGMETILDWIHTIAMEGEGVDEAISTTLSPLSPNYKLQKNIGKAAESLLDD